MRTCSDCLHCKIRVSKKTLSCSLGYWRDYNWKPKTFQVNKGEVGKTDMNLKERAIFKMAQKCEDYEGM